jgi:glucokinase-like ROK family protein
MSRVLKKKELRKNQILNALFDYGQLTLSELSSHTAISLPLVTLLVNELKENNYITELKRTETTQAGRPPVIVKLNKAAGYILGVDLGRINTNFVLIDLEKNIIKEHHKKAFQLSNNEMSFDEIEIDINKFLSEAGIEWKELLGIGISIPGLVQGKNGISHTYFNFTSEPLGEYLTNRFNIPVRIEHDVKAMTSAEICFGAVKDSKDVLYLNYGWGLGLGIIVNGQLYFGNDSYAGEFGHISVVPNGELCYCGKHGCLETVSSGKAISRIASNKLINGANSILKSDEIKLKSIKTKALLEAANRGDQFSIEILENAGKYLGIGIAILINIFNPNKIIIGGDISNVADYILESIRSSAMKHSLVQLNENVEFVISKLGDNAGALGASLLIAKEVLK